MLAECADHLLRDETVKVLDVWKMGMGIATGKLDGPNHTMQERSEGVADIGRIRTWHPGS